MIILIEGFLGDGKTVYMVSCGLDDYKHSRKIYSNLKLYGIEYEELHIEDFLNTENADKYKNATLLIDEITLFMDCRRSGKKENIALSTLLRQSRKRNIDIYCTCQNADEVDLRLIRYTSVFVIAQRLYEELTDDKGNITTRELKTHRHYTVIDDRKRKDNCYNFNMDITKYYGYYDTDEIIQSIYENKQKPNTKTK